MDVDGNSEKSEPLLAAIGNPNVDITVKLKDDSLFKKYDLPFDRATPVDQHFLEVIEQDFRKQNPEIRHSPGGCSQNTSRIFQWLMNSKFNSTIIGSIGADEHGTFLKNELERQGVLTSYTLKNDYRTAFVFIFIYKDFITPVYGASCLASWQYAADDLLADKKALDSLKRSKIALFEGFFVIHSDDAGREAIKICTQHNTLMSFNLSGEYVPKNYPDIVVGYIKSCHIIIGNRVELKAACEFLNISTDDFEKSLIEVFEFMTKEEIPISSPIKSMEKHKKILIVTCGPQPVYCVSGDNNVIKYEVPVVEEHLIKDVTGAGDSFLAGFLYGILHNFSILKTLQLACLVAAEIIQEHGCVIPSKSSSTLLANLV